MTLYTIPDLVWERGFNQQSMTVDTIIGTFDITITGNLIEMWPPSIGRPPVKRDTLEEAQSAANAWYKAKMAEGLKVATVEELRRTLRKALEEMEQA